MEKHSRLNKIRVYLKDQKIDENNWNDSLKIHNTAKRIINCNNAKDNKIQSELNYFYLYYLRILSSYLVEHHSNTVYDDFFSKYLFFVDSNDKVKKTYFWVEYEKSILEEDFKNNSFYYVDLFSGLLLLYLNQLEDGVEEKNKKQFLILWKEQLGVFNIDKFTSIGGSLLCQIKDNFNSLSFKQYDIPIVGWYEYIKPKYLQPSIEFCVYYIYHLSSNLPLNFDSVYFNYRDIKCDELVDYNQSYKLIGIMRSLSIITNETEEEFQAKKIAFIKHLQKKAEQTVKFLKKRYYPNYFFIKIFVLAAKKFEEKLDLSIFKNQQTFRKTHFKKKDLVELDSDYFFSYLYFVLLVFSFIRKDDLTLGISPKESKELRELLFSPYNLVKFDEHQKKYNLLLSLFNYKEKNILGSFDTSLSLIKNVMSVENEICSLETKRKIECNSFLPKTISLTYDNINKEIIESIYKKISNGLSRPTLTKEFILNIELIENGDYPGKKFFFFYFIKKSGDKLLTLKSSYAYYYVFYDSKEIPSSDMITRSKEEARSVLLNHFQKYTKNTQVRYDDKFVVDLVHIVYCFCDYFKSLPLNFLFYNFKALSLIFWMYVLYHNASGLKKNDFRCYISEGFANINRSISNILDLNVCDRFENIIIDVLTNPQLDKEEEINKQRLLKQN